jgi:hypothetical protein
MPAAGRQQAERDRPAPRLRGALILEEVYSATPNT